MEEKMKTKKKAMISQPMAGKTHEEIVETRDKAVAVLEGMGCEVVNTLFTDEDMKGHSGRGLGQMRRRMWMGLEQCPSWWLDQNRFERA